MPCIVVVSLGKWPVRWPLRKKSARWGKRTLQAEGTPVKTSVERRSRWLGQGGAWEESSVRTWGRRQRPSLRGLCRTLMNFPRNAAWGLWLVCTSLPLLLCVWTWDQSFQIALFLTSQEWTGLLDWYSLSNNWSYQRRRKCYLLDNWVEYD